jgi:hypothetical protein
MAFKKAEKYQSKLRAALFGPSGSGKTYSALAIAGGMGSKVALIDSERGSASKYADRFEFDVVELGEKNIDEYIKYITEAGAAGYEVLIIDSLSHAWQELLIENDRLAKTKYNGNTWSAWNEGTPKQRTLIDAILAFPGAYYCNNAVKDRMDAGNVRPEWLHQVKTVSNGTDAGAGKGIEYEFDILLEISTEHFATVIKDRTGKFQDKILEKPGMTFSAELIAWLGEGNSREAATAAEAAECEAATQGIRDIMSGGLFTDPERSEIENKIIACEGSVEKRERLLFLLRWAENKYLERAAVETEKAYFEMEGA